MIIDKYVPACGKQNDIFIIVTQNANREMKLNKWKDQGEKR